MCSEVRVKVEFLLVEKYVEREYRVYDNNLCICMKLYSEHRRKLFWSIWG